MVIRTGILHVPEIDEPAGHILRSLLQQSTASCVVTLERGIAGQRYLVEEILRGWCDEEELDLILTIGGAYPASGPSADEIVPEATLSVIERQLPGIAEMMRAAAQEETMLAMLHRGVAGIRGRSLIVNLPAGAQPVVLFLESVLDLFEPILLHLQRSPIAPRIEDELVLEVGDHLVEPALPHDGETPSTGLDADEFAAFLSRDKDESGRE